MAFIKQTFLQCLSNLVVRSYGVKNACNYVAVIIGFFATSLYGMTWFFEDVQYQKSWCRWSSSLECIWLQECLHHLKCPHHPRNGRPSDSHFKNVLLIVVSPLPPNIPGKEHVGSKIEKVCSIKLSIKWYRCRSNCISGDIHTKIEKSFSHNKSVNLNYKVMSSKANQMVLCTGGPFALGRKA